MNDQNTRGGSFIGLIITAAIIAFLYMFLSDKYFAKEPMPKMDAQTKEIVKEQDIDTTTHTSALESTKQRIKVLEQENIERAENFLPDIQKQYQ